MISPLNLVEGLRVCVAWRGWNDAHMSIILSPQVPPCVFFNDRVKGHVVTPPRLSGGAGRSQGVGVWMRVVVGGREGVLELLTLSKS